MPLPSKRMFTRNGKEVSSRADQPRIHRILALVAACLVATMAVWLHFTTKPFGATLPSVYAQSACGLGTLAGTYGFDGNGFVTAGTVPVAQVGVATANGAGNVSGSLTANVGGVVSTSTFSGTYTVEPNCTGSETTTQSDGTVSHFTFVIVNGGREARFLQTDPDAVFVGRAILQ